MTKLITRYFDDAAKARAVVEELLYRQRFPQKIVKMHDRSEGLGERLSAAGVDAKTAAAYQDRVAKGGAVISVMAGYRPLGVAQMTRELMAKMGATDMGGLVEEVEIKDPPRPATSVFDDHPLFLTRLRDPARRTFHMADWPIPLISRRKPFRESVVPAHARMANFPIPLISKRKPSDGFAFPRHARMANFPIPLISKRKPSDNFAFPRHARMANFPIPLTNRRKPYRGSLIARHARMANWPFPHLINGKRGTNSLMPGAPRMANFPIPLISKRKPADRFAFPRHARMANFPIPLTNRRKPYSGSVIPRHARMGDNPVPLLAKDIEEGLGRRFTISGMFGIPTVIRR